MERGSYKVSDETCRRLVEAAGELFSVHGVEAVTIRDITARAGTKPNAISYHFGGMEGLTDAVWRCALQRWDDHRLDAYLAENEHLLETRDGQSQLITDAIDIYYGKLHADGQPAWINRFLMRSVITAQGAERMEQVIGARLVGTLCKLFERVTGNHDRLSALCWTMDIISPGSYLTASAIDFLTFKSSKGIDHTLLRRQQTTVTRNALFAVGLAE